MSETEKCSNPFKPNCKNTEIKVYIEADGTGQIPICGNCWDFLAENAEWDEKGITLIEKPVLNTDKNGDFHVKICFAEELELLQ